MKEFGKQVWKATVRRLGFYGAIFAVGAGAFAVHAVFFAKKYVHGPHGKRDRITLNYNAWGQAFTHDFSTYRFNTQQRWPEFQNSSPEVQDYVNKAMLNYEYGYTFANGMELDNAINAAVYGQNPNPVPLVWPMPEE
jgi:hypothetical protein